MIIKYLIMYRSKEISRFEYIVLINSPLIFNVRYLRTIDKRN